MKIKELENFLKFTIIIAINVGIACSLLDDTMETIVLNESTKQETSEALTKTITKYITPPKAADQGIKN